MTAPTGAHKCPVLRSVLSLGCFPDKNYLGYTGRCGASIFFEEQFNSSSTDKRFLRGEYNRLKIIFYFRKISFLHNRKNIRLYIFTAAFCGAIFVLTSFHSKKFLVFIFLLEIFTLTCIRKDIEVLLPQKFFLYWKISFLHNQKNIWLYIFTTTFCIAVSVHISFLSKKYSAFRCLLVILSLTCIGKNIGSFTTLFEKCLQLISVLHKSALLVSVVFNNKKSSLRGSEEGSLFWIIAEKKYNVTVHFSYRPYIFFLSQPSLLS